MTRSSRINIPVADLRREPGAPEQLTYTLDRSQETQLLYNEEVIVKEEKEGWARVEAVEQKKYSDAEGWTGYPGWVRSDALIEGEPISRHYTISEPSAALYREPDLKSPIVAQVSMGVRLAMFGQEGAWAHIRLADGRQAALLLPQKRTIFDKARLFLGSPYFWGGRSFFNPQVKNSLTSCDCSGFINLLYRTEGIDIARDAHDQYLQCSKVAYSSMKPGDLIFLEETARPGRMRHVMLFTGGDHFLDFNITDGKAVESTGLQRFGKPFRDIASGGVVGSYLMHFGSLALP